MGGTCIVLWILDSWLRTSQSHCECLYRLYTLLTGFLLGWVLAIFYTALFQDALKLISRAKASNPASREALDNGMYWLKMMHPWKGVVWGICTLPIAWICRGNIDCPVYSLEEMAIPCPWLDAPHRT